jgi:cytidylate kinase
MAVITISRELGSLGDQVVDRLCDELGYCRVDMAMLSRIAEEAGVDVEEIQAMERGVAQRARLVSGAMTSLYRKQASAFEKRAAIDDKTYAQVVRETMTSYADQGDAIIVGRGGQMVLRDRPRVLHVRLYAAPEVRAQRVVEREGLPLPQAERRVAQSDERKRQYIRLMHNNADWRKFTYYHLAIDTGHITPATAAKLIKVAAAERDAQDT